MTSGWCCSECGRPRRKHRSSPWFLCRIRCLIKAAGEGHVACVQALLLTGARQDASNAGFTPLHYAAQLQSDAWYFLLLQALIAARLRSLQREQTSTSSVRKAWLLSTTLSHPPPQRLPRLFGANQKHHFFFRLGPSLCERLSEELPLLRRTFLPTALREEWRRQQSLSRQQPRSPSPWQRRR